MLRLLATVGLWVLLGTLELVAAQPPPSPTGGSAAETTQETRDGAPSSYRVLLLYSEARLTPSVVRTDQALRSTFETHSPRPVYFYTEFLDLNSFRGSALQDTRVVLVTAFNGQEMAERGYAAGALAHVSKHRAGHELVPAVRAAARGERYVSPRLQR